MSYSLIGGRLRERTSRSKVTGRMCFWGCDPEKEIGQTFSWASV
jgi:hypothetical protein